MLQDVEVLSGRRAIRRRVELSCQIHSEVFGRPMPHQVSELSPNGMWVECQLPLNVGDRVVVSLTPPSLDEPLFLHGDVKRVAMRRRVEDTDRGAGMAIEFNHFTDAHEELLADALVGIPPKIGADPDLDEEWVWVDELLVLDDGNDKPHVSDLLGDMNEHDFSFVPLGEALHSERPRWF